MRIQQLPPAVANQIAAGEVIERPASIVKELLENALDAQADSVSIDIGYGGLTQVKISDNGSGIVEEDLPLAIAAHATSKISQLNDLYSIASMGFRGEALASIASVSRLAISSKPAGQQHATMLSTEGGERINLRPCARSQGTTIDVRDIFFNAPVRKRFLKSERSEFQAIELVVKRFALSAPQIAIQLTHNGKQQLSLPSATCDKSKLARIRKLLGKTFIEQSCYLDVEHAGLHLSGWISTEDYQRSQNDKLWIYVNNRMVKDKLLNHAIKQAYESLLHPGRHPACLLYLTINPVEVDVNVHPTKHEVRFQQPRLVHDFISSQLQKALQPPVLQPQYEMPTESKVLKLSEPYTPPPLQTRNLSIPRTELKSWIVLNPSFALLFLQEQPYIVDVIAIQQNWLLDFLNTESLPLACRPLLVPVSFPIKSSRAEAISSYYQALALVGIELDLVGENTLIIRSLPRAVPHLDLKLFLTRVFELEQPATAELLVLLTGCQLFNTQLLSQEEAGVLIDYIQSSANDKFKNWCKHLSTEACRGVLNA
ncbi:DNA mismatch repair protein MutL [Legionella massiliensis]|uniref:DNA mismatch repair protein MutL n=1 Tax=Legionella massiliensis TaxID=1034943 RepID=A0A078L1F7_9GAMM|nr:DNA mismatch repair endonuclease MutL [Legionella massiliensis]CDZ77888.1 DNA mismatch repair protein MutL [Legionella massiliensis]CEE13626.1 DNA mismatch repair protein MutL [Legionella massiliensis]